jgi:hypothetical protein
MVTVGLVTDCSEPAATKYAIGHGVSSLRARDRGVSGSSPSDATPKKASTFPDHRRSEPDDVFTALSIPHTG